MLFEFDPNLHTLYDSNITPLLSAGCEKQRLKHYWSISELKD